MTTSFFKVEVTDAKTATISRKGDKVEYDLLDLISVCRKEDALRWRKFFGIPEPFMPTKPGNYWFAPDDIEGVWTRVITVCEDSQGCLFDDMNGVRIDSYRGDWHPVPVEPPE